MSSEDAASGDENRAKKGVCEVAIKVIVKLIKTRRVGTSCLNVYVHLAEQIESKRRVVFEQFGDEWFQITGSLSQEGCQSTIDGSTVDANG
jgi:hypothetical protein